jgi:ferredoxin
MVTIKVDKEKCSGHARCYAAVPDLFPLDDDGYVDIEAAQVAPERLADAQRGASSCPERALGIVVTGEI